MSYRTEETKDDLTPEAMKRRLERAITGADLAVPTLLPTAERATQALRLVGSGGIVDFSTPYTVRRAIVILENAAV